MSLSHGNGIAYFAVVIWPLIAIYLYRTKSLQAATFWTILGGFMFLPVGTEIDFPLIPPLGKNSIPVVSALIGIWLIKRKSISLMSNYGWVKSLLLLYLVSPLFTVLSNGDPVNISSIYLPGLTMHDALSTMVNQWLFIVPFLFGRNFFRTYEEQLIMFKGLILSGLFYSILILIEVRLSPQLHSMLYGYFPHSFAQQVRSGGYRPVVFMGHGLWVAFYVMTVTVAAITLGKNREKIRKFTSVKISYYFLVLLVLCKSLASLVYGLFAFSLIKYVSTKMQFRIASVIVVLALLYPTMSILKVFPHDQVINLAQVISKDRADSLNFRFQQESILLEHGAKRFYFGWGGWGRNRVHDAETGDDLSVTDGRWIITFGQYGWLGFIAEFGLLAITVFRAYKASKLITNKKELNLLAAHALLVSLIMLDQLPNASLAPWLWLLVGILLGRSEDIITKHKTLIKKSSTT